MALDGITLSMLKNELAEKLIGARIDKIHQPSKEELVISLRWNGGNGKILISASASAPRIHFTESLVDNPKNPPMFCMLMRKHLSGAKLVEIEQFGLERMLHLSFATYNEFGDPVIIKLAVEIMGRHSNIMLIGPDGKIIDAIKRVTADMSSVRQVMPGMSYVFPPAQNKMNTLDLDYMGLIDRLKNGRDIPLSKALMENLDGVSPIVCREISDIVTGGFDTKAHDLTNDDCEKLVNSLEKLAESVKNKNAAPYMVLEENGHPVDFTFIKVNQYGDAMEIRKFETFSEMLDKFYSERSGADRMKQRSNDLFKFVVNLADRISRKLDVQRQELARSTERDILRVKGELIHANLWMIEKGMTSVVLENYYDNCKPVEVKLDPRLSPNQNAQHYFSEYRKADTAERMLKKFIEKGEAELSYIESVFDLLSRARTDDEVIAIREELVSGGYLKNHRKNNQKPVKLAPKEYISTDGFRILCGRNNIQNDKLTFKDSRKNDIWLHTQKIHGSHTVIVTEGREVPETTIQQAAVVAAYNSKGRESSLVPVDYTEIRNVKKPSGSAPGKAVYEHYRTAYVRPAQFENIFGNK
ncbi:MAG: NFACT family protein [Oscillospiraceae bacterium]|nr:NFACT family protein [Oscillospiraceae bacterium]